MDIDIDGIEDVTRAKFNGSADQRLEKLKKTWL